ncbi:uncharacterized protein N0V89_003563 [Didymosphaeria variabile]|uniref:Uncharacterized protein n=1 Tax=Didymosphaeria variabile TaxID=1932322 RepID=A0A9W8XPI9_9PLEO|nr:uncharacterized protein N0V89_003563 [Didymosphaeria variabile]KAJ4355546.1 hypothetical protein N0V89_003563 [Didymosphaeria variabile]
MDGFHVLTFLTFLFPALLVHSVTASPLKASLGAISIVREVSGPINLENLFVRQSGDILVTSVSSPSIYQIYPDNTTSPVALAEVPNVTGLLGIAELEKDVFYVVASNLTTSVNSNEVWKLDLRAQALENGTAHDAAQLSLVARFPSALQLNGMTPLANNDTSHVLISDSGAGTISLLNVDTGAYGVVMADTTMSPLSTGFGIGVNGIRMNGNRLFFTSLDQGIFAQVPVSLQTGAATGPVETILNGTLQRGRLRAVSGWAESLDR